MSIQPLDHPARLPHVAAEPTLHLLRVTDPHTRTSTGILLDRTDATVGAESAVRDTVLLLTTVYRDGAYESLAGTVVRTRLAERTVVVHPTTHTLIDRTEGAFAAEALATAHETALTLLAARYRDDERFRDWATPTGA